MTQITLETLRADYEAVEFQFRKANTEFLCDYNPEHPRWNRYAPAQDHHDLLTEMADQPSDYIPTMSRVGPIIELLFRANLLDVAEKHGLQAAMMFKLSTGQSTQDRRAHDD